jgi:hypothetical protein
VNEPSKCLEENTLSILLPDVPTIGVFYTDNKQGLQDHVFSVLSLPHEQEHCEFILVQAPLAEVISLHPTVYY